MDPTAVVNLALVGLNAILQLISNIKSQGGLTDDQIAAQAQTVTAGNDTAYAQLVAALSALPPSTTKAS
jgi:hypothetical protein